MSDQVDMEQLVQDASVPYAMASEPPLSFRGAGYDYDHEVLVTLPASYPVAPDRSYPVLWAMDGVLQHMLVAGIVNMYAFGRRLPEIIVVSVGHSSEQGMPGFLKREFDLNPPGSWFGDDALAERTTTELNGPFFKDLEPHLRGDRFLDFLVDELRPALAGKYRMNGDHALMGHSSGGYFTGYALLARPGDFSGYIISSGTSRETMQLEEEYAASHEDLPARVFVGAGNGELNLAMSAARIVSRTTMLVENLRMRQYPSLVLKSQLYTDRDHFNVIPPLFADGLEHLYAPEVEKLTQLPA